jgi:hypothetical protein
VVYQEKVRLSKASGTVSHTESNMVRAMVYDRFQKCIKKDTIASEVSYEDQCQIPDHVSGWKEQVGWLLDNGYTPNVTVA